VRGEEVEEAVQEAALEDQDPARPRSSIPD